METNYVVVVEYDGETVEFDCGNDHDLAKKQLAWSSSFEDTTAYIKDVK